jgi:purine-binding chemotaxis protein CheW
MEHTEAVIGAPAAAGETRQFLTFALGDEEFGIDILKVQEIKGYSSITRVPRTPQDIRGVMNLRGTIVPIVDLRTKFQLETRTYDRFTVIIVVVVRGRAVGIVVDAVSDVLDISDGAVQATPEFSNRVDTRFISGMARADEKLIILLDVEKLVGADEAQSVEAA